MPAGAQGPVYISNKGVKFAAYVAWITEKKTYTCYPLNVNASSKYNVVSNLRPEWMMHFSAT